MRGDPPHDGNHASRWRGGASGLCGNVCGCFVTRGDGSAYKPRSARAARNGRGSARIAPDGPTQLNEVAVVGLPDQNWASTKVGNGCTVSMSVNVGIVNTRPSVSRMTGPRASAVRVQPNPARTAKRGTRQVGRLRPAGDETVRPCPERCHRRRRASERKQNQARGSARTPVWQSSNRSPGAWRSRSARESVEWRQSERPTWPRPPLR